MSPHVVVIGGGIAGLASAVWLAESGCRITLLERRGAVGGRTHAISVPQVEDVADNGQHIMIRAYDELYRYLDSIGTRHHMHFAPLGTRTREAKAYTYRPGRRGQLDLLFGDIAGLPRRDRLATAMACMRFFGQSALLPKRLDTMTVDEWYRRIKMPESARTAAFDVLATGLLNELPDRASAYALASVISTAIKKSLRGSGLAFEFGYSDTDFDTLFVDGALRALSGVDHEIQYRAIARQITIRDGRAAGVSLADGRHIEADAVVCAVPAWHIRGLLDQVPGHEAVYAAADRLIPVPIVSVNLYLDRPLDTEHWAENVAGGDNVIDNVFDVQRIHTGRDTTRGFRYALTTSAAYKINDWTNEQIVHAQMDLLRELYPAARDARVVHAHVVRENRSTFSQRPGTAGIRPEQATSVPNLVLAGDWTRTDWPSTMEGAAQSAVRALDVLDPELSRAAVEV